MKIRLIVACLVLAILGGILYWTEYRKPAGATAKVAANTAPVILKLDPAAITKLELKRSGAGSVLLVKEDSGRWQIGGPKPFSADQNAVSGLLATVTSLNSERLVEEKANDRKPYGLDPPAFDLEITEKGNKIQNLQLGDDTPAGNAVYASLAGDPRLFTVSSVIRKSIDKPLDDLRNKKLFAFGFTNPDKVELHIGAKTYLFTRTGEDWQADGKKLERGPCPRARGHASRPFCQWFCRLRFRQADDRGCRYLRRWQTSREGLDRQVRRRLPCQTRERTRSLPARPDCHRQSPESRGRHQARHQRE